MNEWDWMRGLKQEAATVRSLIQAFREQHVYTGETEEFVKKLAELSQRFEDDIRHITENPEIWPWINGSSLMHSCKAVLAALKGYSQALSRRNPDDQAIVQFFAVFSPHIDMIDDRILRRYRSGSPLEHNIDSETCALPPTVIWAVLRSEFISHHELHLPVSVDITEWPPVIYHPYITYWVILELLYSFWLRRHATFVPRHVTARKTLYGCEFAFTVQNWHLTPDIWEGLLAHLRSNTPLESFHMLGGSITPLTWDEGYGQGVIVRLPWASPNTH